MYNHVEHDYGANYKTIFDFDLIRCHVLIKENTS